MNLIEEKLASPHTTENDPLSLNPLKCYIHIGY